MSNQHHYEDGGGAQEYWERESSSEDLEAESLFHVLSEFPLDDPSNTSNPKSRPSSPSQSQSLSQSQSQFPPEFMAYSPLSQLHQAPSNADCGSSKPLLQHFPPTFLPREDTNMCGGNEEGCALDAKNKQPFRRPRSAETHNLAERNRRSRLKDKIRALKETLPDCDKSDADSILTNAISYVESSKLQLQWMADALRRSGGGGEDGGGARNRGSAPHAWINSAPQYNPSFRSSMSTEMPRPVLPLPPPVCYTASQPQRPQVDGLLPSGSGQDGNDTTPALDQCDTS